MQAVASGAVRLARSGRLLTPEGKKEAQILVEAASGADKQLAKKLQDAVEGKVTVQFIPPTRATPRSEPFEDPIVQRVVEVMYEGLSRVNLRSIAEDREYFFVVFVSPVLPPGTPQEAILRNVSASVPVSSERTLVTLHDVGRIESLAVAGEVLGWAHTHGPAKAGFDNENFSDSPGDLSFSRSRGWHGGLGTPGGRFLFFHVGENKDYDLSPMFGSLPF